MSTSLRPVISIRVFREEKCFGPGIRELLRLVERHHSLRAAAAAMELSYSKAWSMVRKCQEELGFPLLSSVTGGKNGGGAELTAEARKLLEDYEAYCRKVRQAAEELFQEVFGDYA